MITIEELRKKLAARLAETGESQNAFARRLGIQQSSISKFLDGKTGIALEPALKILEDMGYRLVGPDSVDEPDQDAVDAQDDKIAREILDLKERLAGSEEMCRILLDTNQNLSQAMKNIGQPKSPEKKESTPHQRSTQSSGPGTGVET